MPQAENDDGLKPTLTQRLSKTFLKPADPNAKTAVEELKGRPADDLEAELRSANDKERLIGLVAAPLAALIGLLVCSALISNDPAATLQNGQPNHLHVAVSVYYEVMVVLVVLSIGMLATAFWRKRLYLGIIMALYGLAVFNLHYWGFGVPFIMAAAWYLVRSYRLQRAWRDANEGTGPNGTPRPRLNKRYTPPARTR